MHPPPLSNVRVIRYVHEGSALTGELYMADSLPCPAILLIHGGAGLDQHARSQATRFVARGYAVFACDMYGDEVRGDPAKTRDLLHEFRADPDRLARRAQAGLDVVADQPEATTVVAAVGYCFGGMAALALARSGATIAGVVSIHGSLATPRPAAAGAVRAQLLVCHGAADPHVPLADVTAFAEEMGKAGANWQLNLYGGAQHGFTHAHAQPGAMPGVAYDPEADRRSFADVGRFLAELAEGLRVPQLEVGELPDRGVRGEGGDPL
jgi:dienelactone hydrolase